MIIRERLNSIYKSDSRRNKFLLVILFSGLAYGFYRGVQDNYLAQIIQISKFERGIVEFFRELPGLFLVFILAAMYRFSESKVFKIGTAIMLLGTLGLLLIGTSKAVVILFMVIFSTGEHITMPIKSSMSLDMAKQGKGGASLGLMSSISNGGNIIGFLVVTVIFAVLGKMGIPDDSIVGFKTVFFIATLLLVCSAIIALAIKDQGKPVKRSKIYFSKKFSKYYMLEIFYGARKQIFLTFAPYVLILFYGADTSLVALLLAICAGFGMLLAPVIGKLIDRLGYKFIMVTDTLLLMVVCFFYGYAHRLFSPDVAFIVVCVNFVLDSIISMASMASKVYVQDIAATQEEMTATITTGISVNHLISVMVALLGGYIWQQVGIEMLFTLSGILGLINTLFALTIKTPMREVVVKEAEARA
ncbi:arabinose efflux permease family protein [Sphaerochaeta pleomorpha str. Grapes]|uniref:Arabinose efflux permease family protein n=1 Tax=Sphaerochaeta pleomorpha (strain ATCC BAA-1885 / DSM 22778 / Grapes) TaxID=158190 RepID=G8QSB7_SPHPG|nr:MFS transporter [Sphaerochaeta pleomorpha]AEV30047.1 arabinose efflux permease family protein [Sphaerochaeta pleomorpha str. Grapes]